MFIKQAGGSLPMDTETLCPHSNDYMTINKKERYSHGFRWKLGINTNPCIQSRKGKRCVYCGFLNYRNPISPLEVGQVFNEVFKSSDLSDIHRLELYVSGSFFDDEEVSFDSRLEVVKSVKESEIKEVVLESRPEFITERNLESLVNIIDGKRITIAIGVETMDDKIRNKLSKGFSTKDLTTSLGRIAQAGMRVQAYLLLNPPAINNDKNAIIDIIGSSKEIINLASKMNCPLILALQPFFLAKNSIVAEDPSQENPVRPPWLYTIALTLRLLDNIRSVMEPNLHIILGNEIDNVDPVLVPSNYASDGNVCPCTRRIKKYLREVNISREKMLEIVHRILESPCSCKRIWESEIGCEINEFNL